MQHLCMVFLSLEAGKCVCVLCELSECRAAICMYDCLCQLMCLCLSI